jgi:hypothetical protein
MYFSDRYYNPDLGIFTQPDKLHYKTPGWTSYHYCNNNPLFYVDPDGRFPFPTKGVNIYSFKAGIGLGCAFGTSYSGSTGTATDRHGMTQFSATANRHITNQNLKEGSSNPSWQILGGVGLTASFEHNQNTNSFEEAINDYAFNLNLDIKGGAGISVGLGENSWNFGVGVGAEMGFSGGDHWNISSSISLSQDEAKQVGFYRSWSVGDATLKSDKNGNAVFEANVKSGIFRKRDTGIKVFCPAIEKNGQYIPNNIWKSKEYQKSVDAN